MSIIEILPPEKIQLFGPIMQAIGLGEDWTLEHQPADGKDRAHLRITSPTRGTIELFRIELTTWGVTVMKKDAKGKWKYSTMRPDIKEMFAVLARKIKRALQKAKPEPAPLSDNVTELHQMIEALRKQLVDETLKSEKLEDIIQDLEESASIARKALEPKPRQGELPNL